MAKRLGVSKNSVCNWEHGRTLPLIETGWRYVHLAERAGVDLDLHDFYAELEPEPPPPTRRAKR
jgi:DNA-binding XRE family transcriptional regulator